VRAGASTNHAVRAVADVNYPRLPRSEGKTIWGRHVELVPQAVPHSMTLQQHVDLFNESARVSKTIRVVLKLFLNCGDWARRK
jgi:hypothetical protein